MDPVYGYQSINVESQERTSTSQLAWVKRLIRIRQRHEVFALGKLQFIPVPNAKVLAFTRTYADAAVLVVCNLSRFSQPAELDLSAWQGRVPVEMFGDTVFPAVGDRPYQLSLGPYTFFWFRLETPDARSP
jgi:maltose alpha-D-glucosyltransferase/alpha-amylase